MIRPAIADDLPTICRLIRRLAEFELLSHEAVFDEARLREHLFGSRPFAEVLLAEEAAQARLGAMLYVARRPVNQKNALRGIKSGMLVLGLAGPAASRERE